ncbi:MAG: hypothetical protein ABI743_06275 [bacterium]
MTRNSKGTLLITPLRYHSATWALLALIAGSLLLVGVAVAGALWWLMLLWQAAINPVDIERILWALVATALVAIWLAPLATNSTRPKGLPMKPSEAPELFKAIRDGWGRAGIPATLQIEICADAGLQLAPPGTLWQGLAGSPRRLWIGMGALEELTADELVSLATASAADWGGSGYAVGGFVGRMLQTFEAVGGAFAAGGCQQYVNPLLFLLAGVTQLLHRPGLLANFAWQAPLFLDVFGIRSGGALIYSGAREKSVLNEALFETTAYNVVVDLMEQGKQLKNLFLYFEESKQQIDSANLTKLRDSIFADETGTAGSGLAGSLAPNLTLPTLSQRLARVEMSPAAASRDTRPSRDLIPNVVDWEERLSERLTTALDQALQSSRAEMWEQHQRDVQTMKDEYENRQQ